MGASPSVSQDNVPDHKIDGHLQRFRRRSSLAESPAHAHVFPIDKSSPPQDSSFDFTPRRASLSDSPWLAPKTADPPRPDGLLPLSLSGIRPPQEMQPSLAQVNKGQQHFPPPRGKEPTSKGAIGLGNVADGLATASSTARKFQSSRSALASPGGRSSRRGLRLSVRFEAGHGVAESSSDRFGTSLDHSRPAEAGLRASHLTSSLQPHAGVGNMKAATATDANYSSMPSASVSIPGTARSHLSDSLSVLSDENRNIQKYSGSHPEVSSSAWSKIMGPSGILCRCLQHVDFVKRGSLGGLKRPDWAMDLCTDNSLESSSGFILECMHSYSKYTGFDPSAVSHPKSKGMHKWQSEFLAYRMDILANSVKEARSGARFANKIQRHRAANYRGKLQARHMCESDGLVPCFKGTVAHSRLARKRYRYPSSDFDGLHGPLWTIESEIKKQIGTSIPSDAGDETEFLLSCGIALRTAFSNGYSIIPKMLQARLKQSCIAKRPLCISGAWSSDTFTYVFRPSSSVRACLVDDNASFTVTETHTQFFKCSGLLQSAETGRVDLADSAVVSVPDCRVLDESMQEDSIHSLSLSFSHRTSDYNNFEIDIPEASFASASHTRHESSSASLSKLYAARRSVYDSQTPAQPSPEFNSRMSAWLLSARHIVHQSSRAISQTEKSGSLCCSCFSDSHFSNLSLLAAHDVLKSVSNSTSGSTAAVCSCCGSDVLDSACRVIAGSSNLELFFVQGSFEHPASAQSSLLAGRAVVNIIGNLPDVCIYKNRSSAAFGSMGSAPSVREFAKVEEINDDRITLAPLCKEGMHLVMKAIPSSIISILPISVLVSIFDSGVDLPYHPCILPCHGCFTLSPESNNEQQPRLNSERKIRVPGSSNSLLCSVSPCLGEGWISLQSILADCTRQEGQLLGRTGEAAVHFAQQILCGVAAGLCHLHLNGFAHGHVHPRNIFVRPCDGLVCLSDVACARLLHGWQLLLDARQSERDARLELEQHMKHFAESEASRTSFCLSFDSLNARYHHHSQMILNEAILKWDQCRSQLHALHRFVLGPPEYSSFYLPRSAMKAPSHSNAPEEIMSIMKVQQWDLHGLAAVITVLGAAVGSPYQRNAFFGETSTDLSTCLSSMRSLCATHCISEETLSFSSPEMQKILDQPQTLPLEWFDLAHSALDCANATLHPGVSDTASVNLLVGAMSISWKSWGLPYRPVLCDAHAAMCHESHWQESCQSLRFISGENRSSWDACPDNSSHSKFFFSEQLNSVMGGEIQSLEDILIGESVSSHMCSLSDGQLLLTGVIHTFNFLSNGWLHGYMSDVVFRRKFRVLLWLSLSATRFFAADERRQSGFDHVIQGIKEMVSLAESFSLVAGDHWSECEHALSSENPLYMKLITHMHRSLAGTKEESSSLSPSAYLSVISSSIFQGLGELRSRVFPEMAMPSQLLSALLSIPSSVCPLGILPGGHPIAIRAVSINTDGTLVLVQRSCASIKLHSRSSKSIDSRRARNHGRTKRQSLFSTLGGPQEIHTAISRESSNDAQLKIRGFGLSRLVTHHDKVKCMSTSVGITWPGMGQIARSFRDSLLERIWISTQFGRVICCTVKPCSSPYFAEALNSRLYDLNLDDESQSADLSFATGLFLHPFQKQGEDLATNVDKEAESDTSADDDSLDHGRSITCIASLNQFCVVFSQGHGLAVISDNRNFNEFSGPCHSQLLVADRWIPRSPVDRLTNICTLSIFNEAQSRCCINLLDSGRIGMVEGEVKYIVACGSTTGAILLFTISEVFEKAQMVHACTSLTLSRLTPSIKRHGSVIRSVSFIPHVKSDKFSPWMCSSAADGLTIGWAWVKSSSSSTGLLGINPVFVVPAVTHLKQLPLAFSALEGSSAVPTTSSVRDRTARQLSKKDLSIVQANLKKGLSNTNMANLGPSTGSSECADEVKAPDGIKAAKSIANSAFVLENPWFWSCTESPSQAFHKLDGMKPDMEALQQLISDGRGSLFRMFSCSDILHLESNKLSGISPSDVSLKDRRIEVTAVQCVRCDVVICGYKNGSIRIWRQFKPKDGTSISSRCWTCIRTCQLHDSSNAISKLHICEDGATVVAMDSSGVASLLCITLNCPSRELEPYVSSDATTLLGRSHRADFGSTTDSSADPKSCTLGDVHVKSSFEWLTSIVPKRLDEFKAPRRVPRPAAMIKFADLAEIPFPRLCVAPIQQSTFISDISLRVLNGFAGCFRIGSQLAVASQDIDSARKCRRILGDIVTAVGNGRQIAAELSRYAGGNLTVHDSSSIKRWALTLDLLKVKDHPKRSQFQKLVAFLLPDLPMSKIALILPELRKARATNHSHLKHLAQFLDLSFFGSNKHTVCLNAPESTLRKSCLTILRMILHPSIPTFFIDRNTGASKQPWLFKHRYIPFSSSRLDSSSSGPSTSQVGFPDHEYIPSSHISLGDPSSCLLSSIRDAFAIIMQSSKNNLGISLHHSLGCEHVLSRVSGFVVANYLSPFNVEQREMSEGEHSNPSASHQHKHFSPSSVETRQNSFHHGIPSLPCQDRLVSASCLSGIPVARLAVSAFLPNSRREFTASLLVKDGKIGLLYCSTDSCLHIFSVSSSSSLQLKQWSSFAANSVSALAFDGKYCVALCDEGSLIVWDLHRLEFMGKVKFDVRLPGGHMNTICDITCGLVPARLVTDLVESSLKASEGRAKFSVQPLFAAPCTDGTVLIFETAVIAACSLSEDARPTSILQVSHDVNLARFAVPYTGSFISKDTPKKACCSLLAVCGHQTVSLIDCWSNCSLHKFTVSAPITDISMVIHCNDQGTIDEKAAFPHLIGIGALSAFQCWELVPCCQGNIVDENLAHSQRSRNAVQSPQESETGESVPFKMQKLYQYEDPKANRIWICMPSAAEMSASSENKHDARSSIITSTSSGIRTIHAVSGKQISFNAWPSALSAESHDKITEYVEKSFEETRESLSGQANHSKGKPVLADSNNLSGLEPSENESHVSRVADGPGRYGAASSKFKSKVLSTIFAAGLKNMSMGHSNKLLNASSSVSHDCQFAAGLRVQDYWTQLKTCCVIRTGWLTDQILISGDSRQRRLQDIIQGGTVVVMAGNMIGEICVQTQLRSFPLEPMSKLSISTPSQEEVISEKSDRMNDSCVSSSTTKHDELFEEFLESDTGLSQFQGYIQNKVDSVLLSASDKLKRRVQKTEKDRGKSILHVDDSSPASVNSNNRYLFVVTVDGGRVGGTPWLLPVLTLLCSETDSQPSQCLPMSQSRSAASVGGPAHGSMRSSGRHRLSSVSNFLMAIGGRASVSYTWICSGASGQVKGLKVEIPALPKIVAAVTDPVCHIANITMQSLSGKLFGDSNSLPLLTFPCRNILHHGCRARNLRLATHVEVAAASLCLVTLVLGCARWTRGSSADVIVRLCGSKSKSEGYRPKLWGVGSVHPCSVIVMAVELPWNIGDIRHVEVSLDPSARRRTRVQIAGILVSVQALPADAAVKHLLRESHSSMQRHWQKFVKASGKRLHASNFGNHSMQRSMHQSIDTSDHLESYLQQLDSSGCTVLQTADQLLEGLGQTFDDGQRRASSTTPSILHSQVTSITDKLGHSKFAFIGSIHQDFGILSYFHGKGRLKASFTECRLPVTYAAAPNYGSWS